MFYHSLCTILVSTRYIYLYLSNSSKILQTRSAPPWYWYDWDWFKTEKRIVSILKKMDILRFIVENLPHFLLKFSFWPASLATTSIYFFIFVECINKLCIALKKFPYPIFKVRIRYFFSTVALLGLLIHSDKARTLFKD